MRDNSPQSLPDSADKKPFPSLPLSINTFNDDGSVYREKDINLANEGSLTWLVKHIVWAGHHGKTVKIIPKPISEAV